MSAPRFTPGPWQAKGDYTIADATTIIANVDGDTHSDGSTTYSYEFIATCEDEYGERSERSQANARLIAAAPGLYDMLEIAARTIETINETFEDHGLDWCENAEAIAKASRAILAKARGEQ